MNTHFEPAHFCEFPRWSETLHDGSNVLIRPIRKQDAAAERAFIESLSPESRHHRFKSRVDVLSEELIDELTNIDYVGKMAFVAIVRDDSRERIVGVSRFTADRERRNGECAIVVADDWHEKGLGSLLLRHLIDTAQRRGIRRVYFLAFAENTKLRDLTHHFGFHTREDPGHPDLTVHELELPQG